MTDLNLKYDFFLVDSLAGVHVGAHALRNTVKSRQIGSDEFCKLTGYAWPLGEPEFLKDSLVKEAIAYLADNPAEYVALVVLKDEYTKTHAVRSSYLPAVLIVR